MTATTDRTAELQRRLESHVEELAGSEEWAKMLETAGRFHRYSPNNILLIAMQRPGATRVAGFQAWKQMGRSVRKGEKGIAILAPCVYRKAEGDDETTRVFFKTAHVFDVSQTEGPDLADECRPVLLEGEAPAGLWDALAAQVLAAGFSLERGKPATPGANGTTEYGPKRVIVRDDVSEAQACKTLAHELAHVLLHDGSQWCRGRIEVEAESVAYVVSAASGLATETYSTAYVARWAQGDVKVLKATAERVCRTARTILDAMGAGQEEEVAA